MMLDRLWLGRILFSLCTILFVGTLLWLSTDYPPRARYIPQMVAVFALVCLSLQLLIDIYSSFSQYRRSSEAAGVPEERKARVQGEVPSPRRELGAYVWLLFLLLGLVLLGFLIFIPIYVLLYLRFQAHTSWLGAGAYGLGTWAFTYFLFVRLFEIRLYSGLLLEPFLES